MSWLLGAIARDPPNQIQVIDEFTVDIALNEHSTVTSISTALLDLTVSTVPDDAFRAAPARTAITKCDMSELSPIFRRRDLVKAISFHLIQRAHSYSPKSFALLLALTVPFSHPLGSVSHRKSFCQSSG